MNVQEPEEFWSRLLKTDTCWLWTTHRGEVPATYGRVFYRRISFVASRLAWELTNGSIPEGLCVLHHCDVPQCCRPDHLWLGTKKQHTQDALKKQRFPRQKVTAKDVGSIRRWHEQGTPQSFICVLLGLKPELVNAIVKGRSWQAVPPKAKGKPLFRGERES